MNDAQGVRRASGHQAAILNRIADDLYQKKPFRPERVKELLGHTPIQVQAGMLLGVIARSGSISDTGVVLCLY